MIVQCCVCKKIRFRERWVELEQLARLGQRVDLRNVSHGYCPACAAEAFAELRQWIAMEQRAGAPVA